VIAACSDRPESDTDRKATPQAVTQNESEEAGEKESGERELTPDQDVIGEDCVAFLRATKVVRPQEEKKDCPTCPTAGTDYEVLQFLGFKIEKIKPSEAGCEVTVQIRAEFNPSPGGMIVGGLTGWIAPEKREQYAQGQTPKGPQLYEVTVTYRRTDGVWRAVEFDKPAQQ